MGLDVWNSWALIEWRRQTVTAACDVAQKQKAGQDKRKSRKAQRGFLNGGEATESCMPLAESTAASASGDERHGAGVISGAWA